MATANTPARRRAPARPRAAAKADSGSFSYLGSEYRLDSKMGVWPLLQFARAAEAGWRSGDVRGLAALHSFLQDVIDPEDWPRFQEDMISKKMSNLEELLSVVRKAVDESLEAMNKAQANGSVRGEVEREAGEA